LLLLNFFLIVSSYLAFSLQECQYLYYVSIVFILVHGQVTIIIVVSVCLFVCAEFFSAVFDPISIKLGHMLYVWI